MNIGPFIQIFLSFSIFVSIYNFNWRDFSTLFKFIPLLHVCKHTIRANFLVSVSCIYIFLGSNATFLFLYLFFFVVVVVAGVWWFCAPDFVWLIHYLQFFYFFVREIWDTTLHEFQSTINICNLIHFRMHMPYYFFLPICSDKNV